MSLISLDRSQPRAGHTAVLKNINYMVDVVHERSHWMVALLGVVQGVRAQEQPKVGGASYLRVS